MKINRRKFMAFAGVSAAVLGMPNWAYAQSKIVFDSVNVFVPAAPGGGWDGLARSIEVASKSAGLVNTFQFENVGGAGGMVGLPKFVSEKKGQGNTIMVGGSVMVGAGITNKSPVTMKDVVPLARLTEEAGVLVVPTSGKIQNWKDFAAAIKANPKAVSVAGGSAGGMVGLPKFVSEKKGQGNTIMIGGSVMVGAGITNKSPVTMKDVVPLARLTEEAGVLVVPTSGKIQNWKDFAAAIKANPKAVSVAGGSAGGTDHLLLGLIVKALGADARNAAYVAFQGGGPANAAILGGQVSAGISGYSEFEEQIKAGKMKAIAVSGNKRIPGVDVPTLKELGLNVTAANWRGVFGAPGINNDQKTKLVDFLTKLHASEAWKKTLTERKWTDVFLSGEAFQKEIDKDIKETGLILKDLGLA